MTAGAALLLLADGRWPAGGHAHSGGLEAAVRSGLVGDGPTLESWLRGRLRTAGEVDAASAAAGWTLAGTADAAPWSALVDEYWARVPVPALREASRALGRATRRAAAASWAVDPVVAAGDDAGDTPWPLAFAAAADAAGVDRPETALAVAAAAVQGPAWSATRLLGLDPYRVAGCLARLAGEIEQVALRAVTCDPADLPALSAPLLDIGAGQHATWEVRLFAS